MVKNRTIRSVWVRLGLGVLGFEAVLVVLTLLFHQYWIFRYISLTDSFFSMGVLACAIASAGLLRNPYGEMLSPWGVFAHSVRTTEEEKRTQLIAEFVEARSFGLRLLAAGLLSILASIVGLFIQ